MAASVFAQTGWKASFMVNPFPSPYLNDWRTNPSIASLSISNGHGTPQQVKIYLTLGYRAKLLSGQFIGRGESNPIMVMTGAPQLIQNNNMINWGNVKYDKSIEQIAVQTGRLPEGEYTACVEIKDMNGITLVSRQCRDFQITYPATPSLVYPANNDSLTNKFPVFQWTPCIVPAGYNLHYSFRLVEVLTGQAPFQAINANAPQFENKNVPATNLSYPPAALQLKEGSKYAWQVQALDQNGYPAATNNGKSEIYVFTVKKTLPITIVTTPETQYFAGMAVVKGKINSYQPGSPASAEPLKNVSISLCTRYKIAKPSVSRNGEVSYDTSSSLPTWAYEFYPELSGTVLASAKTKSDGSFTIGCITDSMGVLKSKYYGALGGYLYRYAYIIINDVSYESPAKKFLAPPASTTDLGTLTVKNNTTTITGNLHYEFSDPGEYIIFPLKSKTIKLQVKYVIHDVKSGKSIALSDYYKPDGGKVLGYANTGPQGEFTFNYKEPEFFGLVEKNQKINHGPVEFPEYWEGDVYRVARIIFTNPEHYLSPSLDIILNTVERYKHYEQVIAYVRSFKLGVHVTTSDKQNAVLPPNSKAAGMRVYVLRKDRPADVPFNEGVQTGAKLFSKYDIVGKGVTDNNGYVEFKRLVKNLNMNDLYYLYACSDSLSELNYESFIGYQQITEADLKDNFNVFDNEYYYGTVSRQIKVFPNPPFISGYVYRSDNKTNALKDASVLLIPGGNPFGLLACTTNDKGGFYFGDVKKFIGSSGKSPSMLLSVAVKGFSDTVITIDGMKWGQKKNFDPPVYMRPKTKAHGRIVASNVDANGLYIGVPAAVTLGDGQTVQTFTKYESKNVNGHLILTPSDGWFECYAAALMNQKLIIKPFGNYFADTQYVAVSPKPEKDLGIRMVKKIEHRVTVKVYKRSPDGKSFTIMENVLVGIENKTSKTWSDSDGEANFVFESPGEDFVVTLETGMPNDPVVARKIGIKNKESKNYQTYMVSVDPAVTVRGKVFVGKDNQPVAYAKVKLDKASLSDTSYGFNTVAYTSYDGSFTLNNVPLGKHYFLAAKGNSNFIGDTKLINVPNGGVQNVEFHLSVYDGMDITSLLGFPIEVSKLDSNKTGIYISGEFSSLPDNQHFSAKGATVKFDSVYIVKSSTVNSKGVPLAYPAKLPVKTNAMSLPLKINKIFFGYLKDESLLKITEENSGKGTLTGKVLFDVGSSFNFSGPLSLPGFYLGMPGSQNATEKLMIPAIQAGGAFTKPVSEGFLALTKDADSIKYIFHNMNAAADPSKSFLKDSTLQLYSSVSSKIENASAVTLKLGNVILHRTYLEDISSTEPLNIQLDTWSLSGTQWSVSNNGGISIDKGTLKTNFLDVPFTGLKLLPTQSSALQISLGQFDFNSMKLAGIAPLTITGKSDFGFDKTAGYWKLIVSGSGTGNCGYISGADLKGLEPSAKINLSNFYLQSDGKKAFAMPGTDYITAYKVATLKPTNLVVFDNSLHVEGQIDMHLPSPLSQTQPSAFIFTKNGTGTDLTLQPFTFGDKINGIEVSFQKPEQILNESGFTAKGIVKEEGKFNFNTTLYRSTDSVAIWVDPGQSLKIGEQKTSLNSISGALRTENNSWKNFWFAGDLQGASGASGRLKFDVIGEVSASGQQLQVSNIPTPFGNLAMSYDFEQGRLTGNLQIDQELAGQGHISANANMVVDKNGWYFFQGGSFALANPHATIQSGILIGDYDVSDEMRNTFMQYSYKAKLQGKMPSGFPSHVNGFYFEGSADMPTPIFPGFDFNFGLVSASLWLNVGADTRLAMNFGEVNTYHIGMDYLLDIGAKLGASIGIACAGVSAQVIVDQGFDGEYRSDGSWYVSGEATLYLKGDTYVGVGCCDSDCDYLGFPCPSPCFDKHLGGDVAIGMKTTMGYNSSSHSPEKKVEFFFK